MKLYTIKPLEWKPDAMGVTAPTLMGWLRVRKTCQAHWYWAFDDGLLNGCASLADGQAQAEACWQARVAGVLEEQK